MKELKMKESSISISAVIHTDLLFSLPFFLHLWLASANVTVNSLCMLMLPAVLHHNDCSLLLQMSLSLIIHLKRFTFISFNLHHAAHMAALKKNDEVYFKSLAGFLLHHSLSRPLLELAVTHT